MADELQDGIEMVPSPPMTRGQQTAWIVGAIGLVAAGALYYVTRLPEGHPYKSCEGIVMIDTACKANIAARMMMGLSPVSQEDIGLPDLEPAQPADYDSATAMEEEAAVGAAAAAAERASAAAAMDEPDAILGSADSSDVLPDTELEMASRQAVELNEMICSQTEQNCEFAKMARRQHIERYGRF